MNKTYLRSAFLILLVFLGGIIGFLTASENWSCPACSFDVNEKITPLVNEEYYPILMQEIENAESTIDIVIYEFKWYDKNNSVTELRDLLVEKQNQGVNVRIILDQSKWYGEITDLSKENSKTGEFLSKNGISVKLDSEKITTHDKLVIIDDETVILGSHNWGSSALTKNNEASAMIKDSGIADYYENYFEFLWKNA
jgi:phosphatidylserine/phosphatidylglycerophosphate/cardiolipin synthase-like enzyme